MEQRGQEHEQSTVTYLYQAALGIGRLCRSRDLSLPVCREVIDRQTADCKKKKMLERKAEKGKGGEGRRVVQAQKELE